MVSRNDFCDIRTLFLAYLSVGKNVFGFDRRNLSGWACPRTSIPCLRPRTAEKAPEDRIPDLHDASSPIGPASRNPRSTKCFFPHFSSPGVGVFHFDFLLIFHGNSKRVTVASKLVSRNDSGDIRTLFLTYLSVRKFIFDFYRSKLSGWASARTSILRLGPGLPAGFSLRPPWGAAFIIKTRGFSPLPHDPGARFPGCTPRRRPLSQ